MPVTVFKFSRLVLAQIAAPNVEAADVEETAVQAERFLRVQLHRRSRETVHFEALLHAAGQIAEHFGVLDNAQLTP